MATNEFAYVLNDILDRGKAEKRLNMKDVAAQADLTASYLSNLKQGKRQPPAQATLRKLFEALRQNQVTDAEIQRLQDAYNRTQAGDQDGAKLLDSFMDEARKDGGKLFEWIAQSVQTHGLVRQAQAAQNAPHARQACDELIKGDRRALIERAIRLLEAARQSSFEGRRMYMTWFQYSRQDELEPIREQLRMALRQFLYVDSPFQLYHLWAGDAARDVSGIVNFLAHYLGTSNCFLYEVPDGQRLPEYAAIEGFGFIEARPAFNESWWIRTVIVNEADAAQANELQAVIEYLEYLLGTEASRKPPLIQTEATLKRFFANPATKKLAAVEHQSAAGERLLIKPSFSAVYRTKENLRKRLETFQLPQDRINTYLENHQQRVDALIQRLEQGKEYAIHEQKAFSRQFNKMLTTEPHDDHACAVRQTERSLLKEQILGALNTIRCHPHCHFALIEQPFLLHLEITGDTAFFAFDHPEAQEDFPFSGEELEVMAWTDHPDVVFQLRREFQAKWQAIDELWRTDTEAGRKNVVNFIVTESLKALVNADVPTQELWAFMYQLLENATYMNRDEINRASLSYEQIAKEIIILCRSFDLILLPVGIGPWEATSLTRTRQRLLYSILNEIERFHVISTQGEIERYWETNQYGNYVFEREWTEQIFRYVHHLLTESPYKISMDVIPSPEDFPVSLEIINQEILLFRKSKRGLNEGGIMVQDKELAQAFVAYLERNLSAKCPEHLKGARNVAKWLEERFLKP